MVLENGTPKFMVWCKELAGYANVSGDYVPGESITKKQFACVRECASCEISDTLSKNYVERIARE